MHRVYPLKMKTHNKTVLQLNMRQRLNSQGDLVSSPVTNRKYFYHNCRLYMT